MTFFTVVVLCGLLCLGLGAYQERACARTGGQCQLDSNRCHGSYLRGKCPRQPGNVKCCTAIQENRCSNAGGVCQFSVNSCSGSYRSGYCPRQPAAVKCCIQGGGGGSEGSSKAEEAMEMIFKSEGGCQNSARDSGNSYRGTTGYTCMGITPGTGYTNRNYFSYAHSACGSRTPALFVKCAHDLNQRAFKTSAAAIYNDKYFGKGGCGALPQPAFYVCADIAVLSGPGRSKAMMRSIGGMGGRSAKEYARALNQVHKNFLVSSSQPGSVKAKFRRGWLNRVNAREQYIDRY